MHRDDHATQFQEGTTSKLSWLHQVLAAERERAQARLREDLNELSERPLERDRGYCGKTDARAYIRVCLFWGPFGFVLKEDQQETAN